MLLKTNMQIQNNYIHTTTPSVSNLNKPYQKPIYDHAKTCLISFIHAKGIGMGVNSFVDVLQQYKDEYLDNSFPFMLDSAGFSIISGEVKVEDITVFMSGYLQILKQAKDIYDYIFSLDIPIFIKTPSANTIQNIGKLNYDSLAGSIKIIEEYPEIGDKFNMVLQWKMLNQYKIWDDIYDDLQLKNYVKSYSVGGLVGLYGICTTLNFAPFIGPCYYWLYRYIERGDFSRPLFIHILGQYHKSSRFIIFFLQHLFNSYLKIVNQTCIITYDTINYSLSSMYKTRVGVDTYYFKDNEFNTVHSYDLTDDILKQIYTTDDSLLKFHENWDNIKADLPLNDTSFLIPTYIFSQIQLDKFFEYFVLKYELVQIFRSKDEVIEVSRDGTVGTTREVKIRKIKSQLKTEFSRFNKYSKTLTINFTKSLMNSMDEIFKFHYSFIYNNMDKQQLDKDMEHFIKSVGFPFDLN